MTENQRSNDSPATTEREQRVRELAHQLWMSEGKPEGRDEEYWRRASERLDAETQASYPPAQSRADRT